MENPGPIFPPEIFEMIIAYNTRVWWSVNKWYAQYGKQHLVETIERHEQVISLSVNKYPELVRIFINMCRWNVFDDSLIVRVIRLLLRKYNGFTYALVFMAIGYHHAKHLLRLIPQLNSEFDYAYHNLHGYLCYNLRNDVIIEIAATRPNAVEFIIDYINTAYNPRYEYRRSMGIKPYQFRDCINVDMGINIMKLSQKKICEIPSLKTPAMHRIGMNLSKAFCVIEMDKSRSLEKCIPLLKLNPGGCTNVELMVYMYEYFVNNIVKYSRLL